MRNNIAMRLVTSSLVALAAVLAGCGDSGNSPTDAPVVDAPMIDAPPAPAVLTISPLTADFGSVASGTTSTGMTFTVTNTGLTASGTLTTVLEGANGSEFNIATNTCNSLAPAATCTVQVTFRPTSPGAKSGALRVSAAMSTVSATLDGMGIVPGALGISPGSSSLGTAVVGTTGATTATITVTNSGTTASGALTVQPTGSNPTEFSFTGCSGQVLAGGANCTITASFIPSSPGNKAAAVTVIGMPGGTVTSTVTATALAPAQITVSPLFSNFGSVVVGSSTTAVFSVGNLGGVPTGALSHLVTGADASSFTVITTTCNGVQLGAGSSCVFTVRFDAGATVGSKVATVTVAGAPGGSIGATLQGTTIAAGGLTISPSSAPFGNLTVGQTSTPTVFTITNTGGSPTGSLTTGMAGANSAEFQIVGGLDGCQGAIVAPGGMCMISVVFGPSSAGAKSASLMVSGTPGGSVTAGLSGNALPGAQLSIAPSSKDFGTVGVGGAPVTDTFTITNLGGAVTGIPSVTLTGSAAFSQTNNCTIALNPLATCTVTVRFAPTAVGAVQTTLAVTATPGGTVQATAFGTGGAAAALTALPSSLSFNGTIGDITAAQTFTIQNNGAVTTGALALTVTGATGDYNLTHNCTTLNAGATCTGSVTFAPTAVGTRTATVNVSATPGGNTTVALTGNARPRLEIISINALPPTTPFDFLNVFVGVVSPSATIVVRNNTAAAQTVTTTPAPAEYQVTACASSSVAAGGTCTATVRFAPTVPGAAAGSVTFAIGAGLANQATQTFTGNGVRALTITGPVNFGNVAVGITSPPQTFTVSNAAGAPTTGTITLSVNAPFAITGSSGCTSLPGGSSGCTFTVTFTPTVIGAANGTLNASATPGGNATLPITGTGVDPFGLLINPSPLPFGSVFSGLTKDLTLTVLNPAGLQTTGALQITLPGGPFAVVTGGGGGTCVHNVTMLAGGASCTIVVRFTAPSGSLSSFDYYSNTLNVQATPGTTLAGTNIPMDGTSRSALSITPLSKTFGTVTPCAIGPYSAPNVGLVLGSPCTNSGVVETQPFVVRNDSANAVTMATLSVVEVINRFAPDAMTQTDGCTGMTLAPSTTCTVTVQFAPTRLTDNTVTLEITTVAAAPYGHVLADPINGLGNNRNPTAAQLSVTSVEENKIAGVIGTLTTTDPDVSQTHSYSLSGADASSFSLSGANNSVLSQNVTYFDFEAKSSYSFTVRTTDQDGAYFDQPITVTIIDVDDPPQAIDDLATVPEDILTPIFVLNNDLDVDGGVAKLVVALSDSNGGLAGNQTAQGGTVVITGGGSGVDYVSALNFCGSDSFSYTLTPTAMAPLNPATWRSTATVNVTVQCVDDAPVAMPDPTVIVKGPIALPFTEDAATVLSVLTNDTDVDCPGLPLPNVPACGPVVIASVTPAMNGMVAINVGQTTVTYTPNLNFCGSDMFTYTLNPGGSTTTVMLAGTCVNDAPSFTKGADQTVLEDAGAQTVAGWATGLSVGPANEAGQTLAFNITGNTNAGLFSAGPAVAPNGTLTYTPAANANGSATITLNIQDNGGTANGGVDTSATQTFVINVTAVNDVPSFTKGADQSAAGAVARTVVGWATALSPGPTNESAQTLSFNVSNNNNALFTVQPAVAANGTLTYTPTGAVGSATVTVSVSDNGGTANGGVDTSASQTFTIMTVPATPVAFDSIKYYADVGHTNPYIEGGYSFAVGIHFDCQVGAGGNREGGLLCAHNADTFTVTRVGGGSFSLISLDGGTQFGGQPISVSDGVNTFVVNGGTVGATPPTGFSNITSFSMTCLGEGCSVDNMLLAP